MGGAGNLTVVGIAERNDASIGFLPFMKVVSPIMLLPVLIIMLIAWLRYLSSHET